MVIHGASATLYASALLNAHITAVIASGHPRSS